MVGRDGGRAAEGASGKGNPGGHDAVWKKSRRNSSETARKFVRNPHARSDSASRFPSRAEPRSLGPSCSVHHLPGMVDEHRSTFNN